MNSNNQYKIIFHIDMNCFYASCEIAKNPKLSNIPLVIAHNDPLRRGIVLTASYEAREYGIKAPMIIRDAMLKCPNLNIVEPNFELYEKYSNAFFKYLYKITPKVEPMSIDEGYLDVTEICKKISALELAKKIQNELYNKLKLPCSIGIAPNKFLAKMASDMKKPLGITILRKREVEKLLWPLPIGDMIGVGKKMKPKLVSIGINTIGDLIKYHDQEKLKAIVGNSMYEYLTNRAHGIDNSEVIYENFDEVGSISNAHTFYNPVIDIKKVKETLKILNNSVSQSLIDKKLCAQTIGIQIKYSNLQQFNRSRSVETPINDSLQMWSIIDDLFDEYYDNHSEIRLVGVFCNRLVDQKQNIKQYSLFDDFNKLSKEESVNKLLKQINTHYGNNAITIGFNKKDKEKENEIR